MIFTPLFTPALDTLIGGERTTVQLVKVYKRSDGYSFDYSLFHRWIELCKEVGFEYFEMSHLFAQWGAKFPPKVVAEVDGSTEKIFGWNTPVSDGGYEEFLKAFLPTLMEELKKEGMWFVCADMDGQTMYDLNLTGPIGLVIGNEGAGVSRLVKEKCDFTASIPMKGDIDSLNASVAAGVLAYEIVRQRLKA